MVPMLHALAFRIAYLLRSRYSCFLDISISAAVVISAVLPLLAVSLAHEYFLSWCKDVGCDTPHATFGVLSLLVVGLISSWAPAIRD